MLSHSSELKEEMLLLRVEPVHLFVIWWLQCQEQLDLGSRLVRSHLVNFPPARSQLADAHGQECEEIKSLVS